MGYTIFLQINLRVKNEHIQKVRTTFEKKRQENNDPAKTFWQNLTIHNTGRIECKEPQNAWCGDDHFVEFITPYVHQGRLDLFGEDGGEWGYYFDGHGNVTII